jgi:hypothetical protein
MMSTSSPKVQWLQEPESNDNFWDIEEARHALRYAVSQLTRKGLVLASKWASEQLLGLPPPLPSTGDTCSPSRAQSNSYNDPISPHDDIILHAETLFHAGELDNAAFYLSEPFGKGSISPGSDLKGRKLGPPLEGLTPHALFFRAYALYLSGERRKEEEISEVS